MAWYQWQGETLILRLRLQPGARQDAILGPYGEDSLRVSIKAPPVDGKANDRLQGFLAESFGVSRARVTLLSGEHSRDKRLAIAQPQQLPPQAQIVPPSRNTP